MRHAYVGLLSLIVALFASQGVHAERRVALVIGNSSYTTIPALPNPKHDARLMTDTLRRVGFEVVTAIDADRRSMGRAIRKFGKTLRLAGKDAVGLIYFAGHGIQARGVNYLIPVDATIEDHADLDVEALSASDILVQMESAGNRLNLVILDACRNNPLQSNVRSADRGLARVKAASGTLVAFAAAPGQVASDGEQSNSPYTAALAKAMVEPGLAVEQVFKRVRVSVEDQTGGRQTPWEESSLRGDFYFTPALQATQTQNPAPTGEQPAGDNSVELAFWDTIKDRGNPALFHDYLRRYPNGLFVGLARTLIGQLDASKARQENQRVEAARLQAEREAADGGSMRAADVAYWNTVKDSRDQALLQSYIDRFPNGVFSTLAQLMIARLKSGAVPLGAEQRLAAVSPGAVTASEAELNADPDLPRKIQSALAEAGCNPGVVDGEWGRNSGAALQRFARYAKLTLPGEHVSGRTLLLLRQNPGRICPLSCGRRQVEKNGRCVAKTCAQGQKLNARGTCVKARAAKKPARRKKTPGAGGHHQCAKNAALDPSVCE